MIESYEVVHAKILQMSHGHRLSFSVLTSCTAAKKPSPAPAEELYLGQQQRELMRGVYVFREARHGSLELKIVSAKHGMLRSDEMVSPYNETFRDVPRPKIRDAGIRLGLPEKAQAFMNEQVDVKLILLGRDYLDACAIDFSRPMASYTVLFNQPASAHLVPITPNLLVVPLGNMDAQRHRCPLTALKGRLAGRILQAVSERAPRMSQAGAR